MLHGFINVNKPSGMTSHDVVARLRKILSMKRIGHTGTLDPQVTGVLPVAVGQATKLTEYLLDSNKTYEGSLVLGISTDTEDITGAITRRLTSSEVPDIINIENAMQQLTGEIKQIPPMYSAVKINGKKLYELARSGKEIERAPRLITIFSFTCLDISTVQIGDYSYPLIAFRVTCSKGTYVRTLCVQLGELLELPACMYSLIRTESAEFQIKDSLSLDLIEELAHMKQNENFLIKMDKPLVDMPSIHLPEVWTSRILNGMPYRELIDDCNKMYSELMGQLFRVYDSANNFFAIYRLTSIDNMHYQWKAEKVFKEVMQYE
jgi:tRNA pseudouridine55 synthase